MKMLDYTEVFRLSDNRKKELYKSWTLLYNKQKKPKYSFQFANRTLKMVVCQCMMHCISNQV